MIFKINKPLKEIMRQSVPCKMIIGNYETEYLQPLNM